MQHHYQYFYQDPKFWVAVSFVLFVALTGKVAWSKITAMLDGRGARIAHELAEASRLRAEAEAMMRQAEADRTASLAESQALIARATAEAERVGVAAAIEAEASAKRRERMAMDRIAAAESSAVAEIRNAAVDIATIATRDVIAETFSAQDDAAMIDAAVADLSKALKAA